MLIQVILSTQITKVNKFLKKLDFALHKYKSFGIIIVKKSGSDIND